MDHTGASEHRSRREAGEGAPGVSGSDSGGRRGGSRAGSPRADSPRGAPNERAEGRQEERGGSGRVGDPPIRPYREILTLEISQAEEEFKRPAVGLLFSGLVAGFGVGVSALTAAAVLTAFDGVAPDAVTRLLVANAFTVGFIIVVLAHTDLFTEYTTIAILPVLTGRSGLPPLARLWGLIYAGNMVGAGLFGILLAVLAPTLGFATPDSIHRLAVRLVDHAWWAVLLSALLTGWLMGLLSWLIAASRDTISQIVFVWLITGTIGFAHLHHPITAAAEITASLRLAGDVAPTAAGGMLFWTTIGTALGGILFAVVISFGHRMGEKGGG